MQENLCGKFLVITVTIANLIPAGFSQETDYKKIFGTDWDKAEKFVAENAGWMKVACDKSNIDYAFLVAVVFPELVRYSALRDKIEISLLKTLYVNLGDEYADFSIGPLQMKPSFAESVLERVKYTGDRKIRNQLRNVVSDDDPKEFRKAIIGDLGDVRREFIYLIAFIKICEYTYPEKWNDDFQKLRFFATAYNCGPGKSADFIKNMLDKKFFSTKLITEEAYSYSDISLYWYKDYKQNSGRI